jgi:TRAP-type C4-dicarboxylate transport system permease small subunit
MSKKIVAAFDGFISLLEKIASAVLVLVVLIIALHVLFRYVLKSPFSWTTQFTSYSLLLFACLGAAQLLKREGHVNVDIFISRVNPHVRNLVHFFTSILGILVCIVIVWFGSITTAEQAAKNTLVLDVYQFPQYLITIIIPFTFFILGLQFIRRTCGSYRRLRKPEVQADPEVKY